MTFMCRNLNSVHVARVGGQSKSSRCRISWRRGWPVRGQGSRTVTRMTPRGAWGSRLGHAAEGEAEERQLRWKGVGSRCVVWVQVPLDLQVEVSSRGQREP